MKAANIVLRDLQGQVAGAIVHASDCKSRLLVLQKVSEDISSGVAPLDGLSVNNAEALMMALGREIEALEQLQEHLRLVDAYTRLLALRLPSVS
jgi:hypothetical protein